MYIDLAVWHIDWKFEGAVFRESPVYQDTMCKDTMCENDTLFEESTHFEDTCKCRVERKGTDAQ